ncbi:DUF7524 family protein [Halolamina salifodinae]|uniref:Uncharacterized protein n=1 Tax=Halolamina salifodinae TaxID=1202767 RepID=A0A8T4GS09_9EURY|nr:hypothetical protein [Halolamina salifodinae]MBP1985639.1 hypothetical protein [Halolamina salifodinae]
MSALSVHLNRGRPRGIDAPASFVADESFDVAIENHGDGSHVHVQLDEALSAVARIRDGDAFVGSGATGHVRVDTREVEEPVSGELTISVGYGAETTAVNVRVEPSEAEGYSLGVDVDERLAEPQPDPSIWPPDAETVGLLTLAVGALLAAAIVAVSIQSQIVVAAAALVALITVVGVVIALA